MKELRQLRNFLADYNEWRRGSELIDQPSPRDLGNALDDVVEILDKLMVTK